MDSAGHADQQPRPLLLRQAAAWISGTTALVAALSVAGTVLRVGFGVAHGPLNVMGMLNLGEETTLPTWYTSALLLAAAAMLMLIGRTQAARRERFARHWLVLGVIFLLLSLDESMAFHERASWPIERIFKPGGAFSYGWVIPAIVLVVVTAAAFARFLLHLPPRTRAAFVIAGAAYVFAALGLEMAEGAYEARWGFETPTYEAMVAVEEVLEMAAVALFVYALLEYACMQWGGLALPLRARGDAAVSSHEPALTAGRAGRERPGPAEPPAAATPGPAVPSRR